MLDEALRSVWAQTLLPSEVHVAVDTKREGAAATRNRALAAARTEWVAFLDSDDLLLPHHLELCLKHATETGADLVYPWFEGDDHIGRFNLPFDARLLRHCNYIPVTVLARTEIVRAAGGFRNVQDAGGTLEDWGCWLSMLDAEARFEHLPERTWILRRHDGNTGGAAWR